MALALGACAPSPERFGDAPVSMPPPSGRGFILSQDGAAAAAVRSALVEAGLQPSDEGALRVDVGFAIRPNRLAVNADPLPPSERQVVVSPAGRRTLSFCRRQAYVLTISFADSRTGRLLSRSGATLSRCRADLAEALPVLARLALPVAMP